MEAVLLSTEDKLAEANLRRAEALVDDIISVNGQILRGVCGAPEWVTEYDKKYAELIGRCGDDFYLELDAVDFFDKILTKLGFDVDLKKRIDAIGKRMHLVGVTAFPAEGNGDDDADIVGKYDVIRQVFLAGDWKFVD